MDQRGGGRSEGEGGGEGGMRCRSRDKVVSLLTTQGLHHLTSLVAGSGGFTEQETQPLGAASQENNVGIVVCLFEMMHVCVCVCVCVSTFLCACAHTFFRVCVCVWFFDWR